MENKFIRVDEVASELGVSKPYAQTYLKTLHNQLSAIFNHAVRFYELRSNPAAKAGNMGTEERKEMLFWTKAEYQRFAEAMTPNYNRPQEGRLSSAQILQRGHKENLQATERGMVHGTGTDNRQAGTAGELSLASRALC